MQRLVRYLLIPVAALVLATAFAAASPEPAKTLPATEPVKTSTAPKVEPAKSPTAEPAKTSTASKAEPAKSGTAEPAKTATAAPTATAPAATPTTAPAATTVSLDAAKTVEAAIEQAASRVSQAVVNIITVREVTAAALDEGSLGPDVPPDVRDFLDRMRRSPRTPLRMQGNGSGCIISSDGYILTSEHVIRDSTDIKVTLSSRKKYAAKVIGADPRRDLAVIKIDAKDLPVAPLGDAAHLKRGQFVLALGSPFGFGRDGQASLSFGIVSGTGRAISGVGREADRYYGNLIQTDAAVNPGNSGGPLINLDGEVVGVNAVISSQSGSSEGVGFAVPIMADTRRIIDRLKKGEEVTYGYLGIQISDVSEEEAQAAGIEAGSGAFISEVIPDTPGAKVGLKTGDIILLIDDSAVRGADDVIQVIQATPVGDKITLTVLRKGKRDKIAAEVARRPGAEEMMAVGGPRDVGQTWRGMRLEPLTEDLRTQTGLKANDRGAFVKEVKDGSPAADAGIIPGMVIDQVGDKRIASIREFSTAVATSDGPVMVHIIGLGVKVIQAPTASAPNTKTPPAEKSKGKAPSPTKTAPEKPAVTPTDKPAVTGTDKPAVTPTAVKSGDK